MKFTTEFKDVKMRFGLGAAVFTINGHSLIFKLDRQIGISDFGLCVSLAISILRAYKDPRSAFAKLKMECILYERLGPYRKVLDAVAQTERTGILEIPGLLYMRVKKPGAPLVMSEAHKLRFLPPCNYLWIKPDRSSLFELAVDWLYGVEESIVVATQLLV